MPKLPKLVIPVTIDSTGVDKGIKDTKDKLKNTRFPNARGDGGAGAPYGNGTNYMPSGAGTFIAPVGGGGSSSPLNPSSTTVRKGSLRGRTFDRWRASMDRLDTAVADQMQFLRQTTSNNWEGARRMGMDHFQSIADRKARAVKAAERSERLARFTKNIVRAGGTELGNFGSKLGGSQLLNVIPEPLRKFGMTPLGMGIGAFVGLSMVSNTARQTKLANAEENSSFKRAMTDPRTGKTIDPAGFGDAVAAASGDAAFSGIDYATTTGLAAVGMLGGFISNSVETIGRAIGGDWSQENFTRVGNGLRASGESLITNWGKMMYANGYQGSAADSAEKQRLAAESAMRNKMLAKSMKGA